MQALQHTSLELQTAAEQEHEDVQAALTHKINSINHFQNSLAAILAEAGAADAACSAAGGTKHMPALSQGSPEQ